MACAVAIAVLWTAAPAPAAMAAIDPETATVAQLQAGMETGALTSEQITAVYIDRTMS